jgi:hypothetical protein
VKQRIERSSYEMASPVVVNGSDGCSSVHTLSDGSLFRSIDIVFHRIQVQVVSAPRPMLMALQAHPSTADIRILGQQECIAKLLGTDLNNPELHYVVS